MYRNAQFIKNKNMNEKNIKYILRNKKKKYFSIKNNNDTIDIMISLITYFRTIINSIYNTFIYFIQSLNLYIFRCHFLLLIIFMLFTFVITFDNNKDIPTSLIISAYFPEKPITRISYDLLLEKEKNVMKIKYKEYQKKKNNFNQNQNDLIENYITCEESCCKKPANTNMQENINKNNINDDTSLKIMFSKMNKQKNNFANWQSSKNVKNLILDKELFKNLIIIMLSFFYCYFFIKYTIYSKIKDSFIFNIFCIIITFNILNILYKLGFYFSSNFFFVAFIYNNKCLIESVFLLMKYNRKDFEVFSTSLIAFNFFQFRLKFIILLNLCSFSGILSIFIFRTWFNYILFYVCVFTFFVFLSNCLEIIKIADYFPKKNTIIFLLGVINLIFSKFISEQLINKFSLNNILNRKNTIDSLYLISDLFSLFCFSYIRKNIEYQIESILLINQIIDKNIKKRDYDYSNIWPFRYIFCISLSFLGIYKKEKICLLMSIYLTKVITSYLINIFDIQKSKILYYIFSSLYLIFNVEFADTEENTYLINLLCSFTGLNKEFVSLILKTFFSLAIYYFIITININIYTSYSEKTKYNIIFKKFVSELDEELQDEVNHPDEPLTFISNCIIIYIDLLFNFFVICLLISVYQYYEKSTIIKAINFISIIIQCISKTLYLKNIKNIFYYYYSNFLWLMFCLRLVSLCQNEYSLIFCIAHLNIEIFLYFYFTTAKDNLLLNIIFYITLFVRTCQLKSILLFLYIVIFILIVILYYIYNNIRYINDDKNGKDKKEEDENSGIENIYISLSVLFLVPITTFFLIKHIFPSQMYIINYLDFLIKDILSLLSVYLRNIKAKENFDWIDSIEFIIIKHCLNFVKNIKNGIYN